jgi:protein O-GlcNAc transferase
MLQIENKPERAEEMLRRAVTSAPAFIGARRALANVLVQQNRFSEAAEQCSAGLAVDPNDAGLASAHAACLLSMGRAEEAVAQMRRECAARPDDPHAWGGLALLMNYMPGATPEEVLAPARRFGEVMPLPPARVYPQSKDPNRRIRVAIVSPDLRTHSVAFFVEPFLKHFDRAALDVVIYQTNRVADAVTARLRPLASAWHVMDNISDEGLAQRIFDDRADVLLELSGHTHANSLGAVNARPAPVQVTYLGYPNTTGLRAVDWRLVDSITDPPGAEAFATEDLWRMDPCFLCYSPPPGAPEPVSAPEARTVTFGSFNAIQKVNHSVVELWSGVLARVPGSRLMLKGMNFADNALRREVQDRFVRAGVDPSRMEILPPAPDVPGHLAHYAKIDIALDPFPYHGTTTTCEALWMGVPVVTLRGETHAARVGPSLLTAVGVPELIAESREQYISIASQLAADASRRSMLRTQLRERMAASPLCDGPGFARRLEGALRAMWRQWCERPAG